MFENRPDVEPPGLLKPAGGVSIVFFVRVTVFAVPMAFLVPAWLYGRPRTRFYCAALRNQPMPSELCGRDVDLEGGGRLSPRARQPMDRVADRLETVVLAGAAFLILYQFATESW